LWVIVVVVEIEFDGLVFMVVSHSPAFASMSQSWKKEFWIVTWRMLKSLRRLPAACRAARPIASSLGRGGEFVHASIV
jgi:hypothetical protein